MSPTLHKANGENRDESEDTYFQIHVAACKRCCKAMWGGCTHLNGVTTSGLIAKQLSKMGTAWKSLRQANPSHE